MSGGIAYVYDDLGQFSKLCNMEMVDLEQHEQFKPQDTETIHRLLESHHKYTQSTKAKAILDDWKNELRWFVKVMPTDYRRVLEHQAEIDERAKKLSERQAATV